MNAEWSQHVKTIMVVARKMGLETGGDVLYAPRAEIDIEKNGKRIGQIDWVPEDGVGAPWVARGADWCGQNHSDLKDAMKELAANHKRYGKKAHIKAHRHEVFEVVLEFDKELEPLWTSKGEPTKRQGLNQYTEAFLADVIFAYRHHLVPEGTKLTKIRVGDAERTA